MEQQQQQEEQEEQEYSPSSSFGSQVAFLKKKRSTGLSPLGREPMSSIMSSSSSSTEQQSQASYFSSDQQQQQQQRLPMVREASSASSGNGSSKVSPMDAKLDKWASLVWRDLTVTLDESKVVQSLSGYAMPGTLTAILGTASSGKAHLLRALAGRLPRRARVYGEVLLNGRPRYLKYGTYAYVQRGDDLYETLTVRETLYYAALLQLPTCLPCAEKLAVVEAVISVMELEDVAALGVGGGCCIVRGLSAGERRRLTIAIELLMRPPLLFCEEPITGLDNASSFLLVASLKKLASAGCTVFITTERTCTEVFHLITSLCLLSRGKAIYFGDTAACLEHFAASGFPCPSLQNPTDHFLRALNPEFEKVNRVVKLNQDYEQGDSPWRKLDVSVIIRALETSYAASSDAAAVEAFANNLADSEGPFLKSRGHAPFTTRLAAVTWRSFYNMLRSFRYFWLKLLLQALLMVCVGTVFYNLVDSIREKMSAVFCIVSFLCLLSLGGFPALAHELKVYRREKENEHTSALVFVLANSLASFPYLFLTAALCSSIVYFLIGFRITVGLLLYFVVTILCCVAISEGMLLTIASITGDTFSGMLLMAISQLVMMLACGYFRSSKDIPKPVWKFPLSYISFHAYAIEGLLENEFARSMVLQQTLLLPGSKKWMDLTVLAGMAVVYRVILYLLLLFNKKQRNP